VRCVCAGGRQPWPEGLHTRSGQLEGTDRAHVWCGGEEEEGKDGSDEPVQDPGAQQGRLGSAAGCAGEAGDSRFPNGHPRILLRGLRTSTCLHMLLASARGRMVALRLLGAPQDSPLVLTTALIAGDQVILHILKKAGLLNREIKVT
jgi:hypothetical protein